MSSRLFAFQKTRIPKLSYDFNQKKRKRHTKKRDNENNLRKYNI